MTASSGGGGNVRHTTFAEQHSRGNRKQGTIESQQLSLDQTRSMLTFPLHGKIHGKYLLHATSERISCNPQPYPQTRLADATTRAAADEQQKQTRAKHRRWIFFGELNSSHSSRRKTRLMYSYNDTARRTTALLDAAASLGTSGAQTRTAPTKEEILAR
jgi:hypothetical protein